MKMLIAVPVYNRLAVTELCLKSVYEHRGDAVVHVYNDHSTEFAAGALAAFCDEVFTLPPRNQPVFRMEKNTRGMGVQHLRWHQFRDFLGRPEFDYLYFTDSDALHDPSYLPTLRSLRAAMESKGQSLPVCLYNSCFHSARENQISESSRLLVRKSAPGISHLYTRGMVETIVRGLDALGADPDYDWDYHVSRFLRLPFVTTRTSYVEHFGAGPGSMHTRNGDWDRDRALNPTPYLARVRPAVIEYLESRYAAASVPA